ncbi:hypothetical protein I317_02930 [Kwoniella heveanensis CBS 569]|nr:hypothetical protein I317_02930 [Kwoniella heveanensis CBS 569]
MLTWPCEYLGCDKRSVYVYTHHCVYCGKHFCFAHNGKPYHDECSNLSEEKGEEARYRVDLEIGSDLVKRVKSHAAQITSIASSLRDGMPCHMDDIPDNPWKHLQGCVNMFFPVVFEDGVNWLVRSKLLDNRPPLDGFNRAIIESEVQTIKILREYGLNVPGAHIPPRSAMKNCNVNFFFSEFIEGNPMDAPFHAGEEPRDKIDKIIYQLAEFLVKLSETTFPAIGRLYPCSYSPSSNLEESSDAEIVPPLRANQVALSPSPTIDEGYIIGPLPDTFLCEIEPPYFLGPFKCNRERYVATADYILSNIMSGVLYPDHAISNYLWHLELREMFLAFDKWGDEDGLFYLKHADDKGDHILANKEGNITGLVDWEWAYATSKAEAFAAPTACFGSEEYDGPVNALHPSEMKLMEAYEQLGRPDLAECVKNGRFYHRLAVFLGYPPASVELMDGFRELMGLKQCGYVTLEEWIQGMSVKYAEDVGYQTLVQRDNDQ